MNENAIPSASYGHAPRVQPLTLRKAQLFSLPHSDSAAAVVPSDGTRPYSSRCVRTPERAGGSPQGRPAPGLRMHDFPRMNNARLKHLGETRLPHISAGRQEFEGWEAGEVKGRKKDVHIMDMGAAGGGTYSLQDADWEVGLGCAQPGGLHVGSRVPSYNNFSVDSAQWRPAHSPGWLQRNSKKHITRSHQSGSILQEGSQRPCDRSRAGLSRV